MIYAFVLLNFTVFAFVLLNFTVYAFDLLNYMFWFCLISRYMFTFCLISRYLLYYMFWFCLISRYMLSFCLISRYLLYYMFWFCLISRYMLSFCLISRYMFSSVIYFNFLDMQPRVCVCGSYDCWRMYCVYSHGDGALVKFRRVSSPGVIWSASDGLFCCRSDALITGRLLQYMYIGNSYEHNCNFWWFWKLKAGVLDLIVDV